MSIKVKEQVKNLAAKCLKIFKSPGIQKNRYYILAFIIPLMTMMIADIAMGVYPFGQRSVLIIDSFHQYAPFFSEF